mmetsp:Transcript_1228/g.2865  ORF Transcript_1228/g.2865 Transcript_1228/m.2865 type:complete len:369 (+) Transcript_1228:945-2051(+)
MLRDGGLQSAKGVARNVGERGPRVQHRLVALLPLTLGHGQPVGRDGDAMQVDVVVVRVARIVDQRHIMQPQLGGQRHVADHEGARALGVPKAQREDRLDGARLGKLVRDGHIRAAKPHQPIRRLVEDLAGLPGLAAKRDAHRLGVAEVHHVRHHVTRGRAALRIIAGVGAFILFAAASWAAALAPRVRTPAGNLLKGGRRSGVECGIHLVLPTLRARAVDAGHVGHGAARVNDHRESLCGCAQLELRVKVPQILHRAVQRQRPVGQHPARRVPSVASNVPVAPLQREHQAAGAVDLPAVGAQAHRGATQLPQVQAAAPEGERDRPPRAARRGYDCNVQQYSLQQYPYMRSQRPHRRRHRRCPPRYRRS